MGTRCMVLVVDDYTPLPDALKGGGRISSAELQGVEGVLLYHHMDGYPEAMLPALRRFLIHAHSLVTEGPCYWWDCERVAAIIVGASVGKYMHPDYNPDNNETAREWGGRKNGTGWGVPRFQPCCLPHDDIEYLYLVELRGTARGGVIPHAVITAYLVECEEDIFELEPFKSLSLEG